MTARPTETERRRAAGECIAALLRAIVLQTLLVTFSPPWSES